MTTGRGTRLASAMLVLSLHAAASVAAAPAAPLHVAGRAGAAATDGFGLADMRWHRRVLLLFAPDRRSPALARQRAILAAWGGQAESRDLAMVVVIGDRVEGAVDPAASLRRRFRPAAGFTAILIGKDGGEKRRAAAPIAAETLERTIDAMPMRRNGER